MTVKRRTTKTWPLISAALLLCGTAAGPARADGSLQDKAAAEVLYEEAKKLMADGKFDAACPKLAESQRLDPGVGALLTLGECYEHIDRKASAWAAFREAAALAKTKKQASREKIARTRASALEKKLSKLIIEVPSTSEVSGIAVTRDGEPVGKALWGTALPVDGGEHTITATAPGRKPWTTKVTMNKDGQVITASVPALTVEDAPVATAKATTDKPPPPPPSRGSAQRILGFVAGGLGLGGIGAGVGLGLVALSKHDEAQSRCTPTCAAGGGVPLQEEAKTFALGSTIAFTAGGVLAGAGILLLIIAPSSKPETVGAAPIITADYQGMVVRGNF